MSVYIGTIVQTKGYEGMAVISDLQPDIPILEKGMRVQVGYSDKFSRSLTIKTWKNSKVGALVVFNEIHSDSEVRELKEMGVFAKKEDLQKIDNHFIPLDEIIGCILINDETDEEIGEILEVWETPANKVWLVSYGDKEVTIPVIDDVVLEIDIENKVIYVNLLEGLLD